MAFKNTNGKRLKIQTESVWKVAFENTNGKRLESGVWKYKRFAFETFIRGVCYTFANGVGIFFSVWKLQTPFETVNQKFLKFASDDTYMYYIYILFIFEAYKGTGISKILLPLIQKEGGA